MVNKFNAGDKLRLQEWTGNKYRNINPGDEGVVFDWFLSTRTGGIVYEVEFPTGLSLIHESDLDLVAKEEQESPANRTVHQADCPLKKLRELADAAFILRDDAEFFTGDIRKMTAWERFTNAVAQIEYWYHDQVETEN